MKQIELELVKHEYKQGQTPPQQEPNYTENVLFMENNIAVGFYLKDLPQKLINLIDIANIEFLSDRVPKSNLRRASSVQESFGLLEKGQGVTQYSCILGSIPAKAIMKRDVPNKSSVHSDKNAQTYIKAMIMAGKEAFQLIKDIAPDIAENHIKALYERVPEKWRFSDYFTSTICNYNIAAPIHRDTMNVVGCVNIIITKRLNSTGGNLYVPDYDLTFESANNSMIVYPAWKNFHGVTEINTTAHNGYRNSLIWYALDRFYNYG